MKRRMFLGAAGAAAAGMAGCTVNEREESLPGGSPAAAGDGTVYDDDGLVGGKPLDELREEHRYWLFEDYLPFLYRHVVDHEYGGFMCNTDREGNNLNTNKRAWFEGRGIWVQSFLYNRIDPDPKHLDIATKSVDFVMKLKPGGDDFWPMSFDRTGNPLTYDSLVYGDLFIATGLQEYSKAVGDDSWWETAKQIMLKCLRRYDAPDYGSSRHGSTPIANPGTRFLGHWMIFIRLCSQMLEKKDDPEVKAVVDRCLDAILDRHVHPEYGMLVEELPHDLAFDPDETYDTIALGHGTETLWMVMFEALRRGDRALCDKAAALFRKQVEAAWDGVYGGAFMGLTFSPEDAAMTYRTAKSLWLQEEILIGAMFLMEHFGDEWAKDWYRRMYTYVLDKFPLKQYGYPLWILYADQKVTFQKESNRVGNFHHPRHLMTNLLAIDRMLERRGAVSAAFA